MADTIRTRAALQVLLADNVGGDISAQDIRDFLMSCVLRNPEGTVNLEGDIRAALYLTGNLATQTNVGNVWFMSPESGKTGDETVAGIVGRTTTTDDDRGADIEFWTKEDASGETGIVKRMVIQHNGFVGIQTSTPENVLHLGDLALGEGIKLQNASGGSALDQAWGLEVGISGVDERYFAIYDYARTGGGSAGYRFVITDDDGFVGIGTTTPLSKLSINGGLHVGGDSDAGDDNALIDGILTVSGNRMALRTVSNSLANNAVGTVGDIAIGTDTNKYLYIWYATNTPSRVQLDTW